MPELITNRAGVEALRQRTAEALAAAGHRAWSRLLTEVVTWDDGDSATCLFAAAEQIPLASDLHPACRWLGETFQSLAEDREDEAYRWAFRAAAELERFNQVLEARA